MVTFILILLLLACSCDRQEAAVQYTNPILHMDYSDPDVCRVGEDYYMTASSFNCFPVLPILHSRDLVHWEQIGAALLDYPCDGTEADFRVAVQHGNGVWAPAIRYHNGWFYIYVGDPDRGIFMVRSQAPAGIWEKPVWVVRQKGFIDPCPLWDKDGKAYLSHGLAGSRAGLKSVFFVAPMAPDGTSLTGPSRIVYDGHKTQPTIEGTKFYRRGEYYYIFSPAGGVSTGWQTVLRAKNPFGPYEEKIVMAWAPGTINGPHQGAWVEGRGGVRLYSVEQKWPYRSLWDCPNVLQQKFSAESFTVEAWLTFCPNPQLKQRGETAGFVVMGNDYAGLRITDTEGGAVLSYITCEGASKGAIETAIPLCLLPYASHPQPHKYESGNVPPVYYPDRQEATLYVRLEVAPRPVEGNVPDAVCRFSYSHDGSEWTTVPVEFIARPELWIGAKWGFFCNRFSPKNDAGWLDVQLVN